MPAGVGDQRRQDDRPCPLGHYESEQQLQHGNHERQHQNLTKLDADVERQERRQQMRPSELHRLTQREGKTKSMHEAEYEGDDPPPAQLDGRRGSSHVMSNILERHVNDRHRDQRLDERRKPQRVRRVAVRR